MDFPTCCRPAPFSVLLQSQIKEERAALEDTCASLEHEKAEMAQALASLKLQVVSEPILLKFLLYSENSCDGRTIYVARDFSGADFGDKEMHLYC